MKTISIAILAFGLLIAAGCKRSKPTATDEGDNKPGTPTATKGRGTFTIGKATTYVTGPLDADGHIDYAAALNERLSKGVTTENNANVLIWKALGPYPEGAKMPAGFFEKLGIPEPPASGEYFIGLRQYAEKNRPGTGNAALDTLSRLGKQPWTAQQYPDISAWLTANEKPLALVFDATKRLEYYMPLVPPRNEKGSTGLINSLLPSVQACRELVAAQTALAMLHVGNGMTDAAWQDLLACHRLGRLVGRGGTLIEGLVGIAIEQIACRADLALLEYAKPDEKHLESYIRDLRALPLPPDVAEKIELSERFTLLDIIMLVDRHGIAYLQNMTGGGKTTDRAGDMFSEIVLQGINWDPALENANRWYGRMADAMRVKTRAERVRKYGQIEAELRALKVVATDKTSLSKMLMDGKEPGKAKGEAVGDILISLMMPAANKVQEAADRSAQTIDNVITAFALAWYQRDNGRYPDRLDALAPKYLKEVPHDLFSGNALIYRPAPNGYLLYSVGVNGRDDGGRGYEDQPAGDDLVVRMPVAPPPK